MSHLYTVKWYQEEKVQGCDRSDQRCHYHPHCSLQGTHAPTPYLLNPLVSSPPGLIPLVNILPQPAPTRTRSSVIPLSSCGCSPAKPRLRCWPRAQRGANVCVVSLQAEIAWVQSIGVPPDKIFYSSPCKQVAHIKYAASHGVQLMAFDNEVELSKVARSHPGARWVSGSITAQGAAGVGAVGWLWGDRGPETPQHRVALLCRMLLGIAADSSPSAHPSMRFGTTLKSCRHLLEMAKEQAVEVVGIRYSAWSFIHRDRTEVLGATSCSGGE